MIDRRSFLRVLLAGAAGVVLDPEKLLWVPGQKTIFLPSPAQVAFMARPVHPAVFGDTAMIDKVLKEYYGGYVYGAMNQTSPLWDVVRDAKPRQPGDRVVLSCHIDEE